MSASPQTSCLRFDSLKFRDQLVLWAAREWIAASSEGPTMPTLVQEAFDVAGVPEATALLHATLTIISTGARRTILFSPAGSPMVCAEEARFLTLLMLARTDGCDAYATQLLLQWVPVPVALRARTVVRDLAQCVFVELGSDADACPQPPGTEFSLSFPWPDHGATRVH